MPERVRFEGVPVAFWVNPQTRAVSVDVNDLVGYMEGLCTDLPREAAAYSLFITHWLDSERTRALADAAKEMSQGHEYDVADARVVVTETMEEPGC